jgi:hypothetical protein
MKRIVGLYLGCLLMATAVDAQGPPQGPVGTATALQRNYAQLKNNITASAEKLSDADYSFADPDVRGDSLGPRGRRAVWPVLGIKGAQPRQGQPTRAAHEQSRHSESAGRVVRVLRRRFVDR